MNIKEKAEHFYNTAVDAATALNTTMVDDYTALLNKNFDDYKRDAQQKAAAFLKSETERLHREKNSALALQILNVRHRQSERANDLKEMLFFDVKNRLMEFMKTKEYEKLLEKQILEAIAFSDGLPMTIYINPSDANKQERLEAATGVRLTVSATDFWGGIRAVIHEKEILINNSFESKYKDVKETFSMI